MVQEVKAAEKEYWPWQAATAPKVLLSFGVDLTEQAARNKLDPVVGRKKETARIIQILCRRKKNNAIVIGEPGVGKTAIIEGLAQRIVNRAVPKALEKTHLISLDLAAVLAGTKYRGEFEKRLKTIFEEVRNTPLIILFIDEIHVMVGAGASESSLGASNIFKPPLSKGELQCIGATTFDEYRVRIEKDRALERRFQPVIVEPSTPEETIEILFGHRAGLEQHHNVKITDDAIRAAVALSDRYIAGRFLPDKAIDVIDEAASKQCLSQTTIPPETTALDTEIQRLEFEKAQAIQAQDFAQAAEVRNWLERKKNERDEMLRRWKAEQMPVNIIVDENSVTETVAMMTGIPVGNLKEDEAVRLIRMEDYLHQTVVGQNAAISALSQTIRRARAGLKDPRRPYGSFIFVGPTGVGKTLVAKTLASFIFGCEDALLQFDMSEYMERHNVSRLIGAPPGYVGYEAGGQLTEKVRRQPYAVILFDEIEKAHPDFANVLLQILEEGWLTDSFGRRIDFRNTIIIMTSNLGARLFTDSSGIGFYPLSDSHREKILDEVQKHFRPEFLSRIDDIIVFEPFTPDDLQKIFQKELGKLMEILERRSICLKVTPVAEHYLIQAGYSDRLGARGLRRIIEKEVENPLSELILSGKVNAGDEAIVDLENEQLHVCLPVEENAAS